MGGRSLVKFWGPMSLLHYSGLMADPVLGPETSPSPVSVCLSTVKGVFQCTCTTGFPVQGFAWRETGGND